ncbi:hypothetical protein EV175_001736 [Coemansia sp. RSA 1933]|nr:hypothetical protein EV175_001736 [Coemansia sp. RSA 1933]
MDIRIVAITDLIASVNERTENIANDDAARYTESLFTALSDKQSYVQSLATECLAACVRVIDISLVVSVVEKICDRIREPQKDDSPSTMSGALRQLTSRIATKPDDKASLARLAIPVVNTLKGSSDLNSDVVVDIFTALIDVLTHAGAQVANNAEALDSVQNLLLKYIDDKNPANSRRAVAVLGTFVVSVPIEQAQKALGVILERYNNPTSESAKCTMLRVIVNISRQQPELIRDSAKDIIERELKIVNETEIETDNELRVASLLAFKTFVASTPDLVRSNLKGIYDVAVEAVKFDPSYNYDEDEDENLDEDKSMDIGSEGDFDDEFDDDIYEDNDIYEDDEDASWDIRLGGVRLLSAIAESKLYTPEAMVQDIGSLLVSRFKEHEDVVRAELLFTYAKLLETLAQRLSSLNDSSSMDVDSGTNDLIKQQIPVAVSSLLSSINANPKHTETRQLAFVILARFVTLNVAAVDEILSKIAPFVVWALEISDAAGTSQAATTGIVKPNVKTDALNFLLEYSRYTDMSEKADEFLFEIKSKITDAASSGLVMVQVSAYNVASAIIERLRVAADSTGKQVGRYLDWVSGVTDLATKTVDSKDSALYVAIYPVIGVCLQQFGDLLDANVVVKALTVLTEWRQGVEKMHASMNALIPVVAKNTHLPERYVIDIASSLTGQVSEQLQSSNVKSQQPALALVKILSKYNTDAVSTLAHSIVTRIVEIISATPESPSLLALEAFSGMCAYVSVETITAISPKLLASLSQATVYDKVSAGAMSDLYRTVGKVFPSVVQSWEAVLIGNWVASYKQFDSLRASKETETTQVLSPITKLPVLAKVIVALRSGYCEQNGEPLSEMFMSTLGTMPKTAEDVANMCLNMRALGYLAINDNLQESESLYDRIYVHAQSSSADIRSEAAFALGNYVGAFPSKFAELFESAMEAVEAETGASADEGARNANSADKLQAVKTAVSYTLGDKPELEIVRDMWNMVAGAAQTSAGPIPDILAQCLSMISVRLPQMFIPQLASCMESSKTQHAKAFFITAFRTLLADKSVEGQCDKEIEAVLPVVMSSIRDNDINIRKLGLLALYTVIQSKAVLLGGLAETIQPTLFEQTVVNEKLVRIIPMGPFKKRVDDGLDARRCAYQCVHMLVRNLSSVVDTAAVVDSVIRGITDEQDIRAVVQQIVSESVTSFPTVYKARLDDLVDAISTMQAKKIGKNAVNQEIEKHHEMLKATVSIVHTMEQIFPKTEADSSKFGKLVQGLENMSGSEPNANELATFYKEIK